MTEPNIRPDSDIFSEARAALDRDPGVPHTVRLHVHRGIVTLTGSVRWAAERTQAEAALRDIDGIQRLVNDVTVAASVNAAGFEPPSRGGQAS
jgi:osmotically-inducible protein OsmY